MLVLEWKKRASIEKVNSRCFRWFPAAILVHQNGTPIWRLHTKLYKGAWNVSANNSETMGHKDLRLGQIVYILVFYNISFSWLLPLDGFQFIFLLRDSENDPRETIYKLTWSEQNVCSVSLLDVVSKRLVLKNNFVSKRPASFRGVIFITVHIWSLADDSMAPLGL